MRVLSFGLLIAPLWTVAAYANIFGTASSFAVLGGSTVTNTGASVVNGNLGVSPGNSVTGLPTGIVTGALHVADAVALQAQVDLTNAYVSLAGLAPTETLTGQNLGGLTLTPGVYKFTSDAQLTGTLTLDATPNASNPNPFWVFQIGTTLTTASGSAVNIINNNTTEGLSLFWQVGSSATLGTTTAFEGNIVALTSITMNTGATIGCGRALARNGAVTLDTNTVGTVANGCSVFANDGDGGLNGGPISGQLISATPEPFLMVPLGFGMVGLALQITRKRARAAVSKL